MHFRIVVNWLLENTNRKPFARLDANPPVSIAVAGVASEQFARWLDHRILRRAAIGVGHIVSPGNNLVNLYDSRAAARDGKWPVQYGRVRRALSNNRRGRLGAWFNSLSG